MLNVCPLFTEYNTFLNVVSSMILPRYRNLSAIKIGYILQGLFTRLVETDPIIPLQLPVV